MSEAKKRARPDVNEAKKRACPAGTVTSSPPSRAARPLAAPAEGASKPPASAEQPPTAPPTTAERPLPRRAEERGPRKRTKLPPERPGRPGGVRARNRDVRIAALTGAGLELFLARGVESVSIDEIAREAGMAKGNFYRYFDDKRALVDHLLAPVAAEVRTAMRKCAVSLGRASDPAAMGLAYAMLAMELAQATSSRLDVVRLYLQENRAPATPSTAGVRALADELADGAVKLTIAAVDRGLLDVADPRVSGLAVVGATEQLAISVLRGQLDAPPLEVGRIVVGMVLDGIRVR